MDKTSEIQIKQAVRRRYAKLAVLNEPCCEADSTPTSEVHIVPKESVASAASCGSPLTHTQLHEGDVVLDLGSGGGIDVFRASKLVGPKGKVIGIDSTPEMIFKARELAGKYGYANVEFRLGEIEHMPRESSSVDLVISNCVLNLVPDKVLAFKEIYRVLKPGGRISVSDMVATTKTARDEAIDPENWAECITGAVTIDEYERLLETAGFQEINHLDESSPTNETCCSSSLPVKSVAWSATKPST
jgi:SAM-dependent methyltransferase